VGGRPEATPLPSLIRLSRPPLVDFSVKKRVDVVLVDRGLVESRARAQALIMAGKVFSGERRVGKAGDTVADDAPLEIRGADHPWVSRGGLKLAHGIAHFGLSPLGQVCLDVGSSTGGFTDVLLHEGASRVYAVDVGHGQLAWRLRNDPRVVVHEKTNARYLNSTQIPEPIDVLVCDASFIGQRVLLPAPLALCAPDAWAIVLIKPQFEAGADLVSAGRGVIRDPEVHRAVCAEIAAWWSSQSGWKVLGIEESPITGPEGNREFLLAARFSGPT